jgi:hypothetical protein
VFVTPLSINSGVRTNNLGQLETVAMTAGQLLIGSSTGAPQAATLTGTTNQVIVTNGDGAITLSLPQDIHTGATPTFAGATLNGLLDVTTGGATILGTTSINASGTAATNIGNTTGGTVTIAVNSGTTDLSLQGIAADNASTVFLTLDGTNVRTRTLASFLIANNGVTYDDGGDGAFRLGGNAAGESPFTENRFLSLAAFDLTIGGTPGDYLVIDGGATDGSVNVNSFGTGDIRLTSSNGITLDASSGGGPQNINILATSPGGELGLSSNGQMTLNSGASDIVISVTSAGSIVDIDANGVGSLVNIDATGSTNINTAISSGDVTVGNTTNTVALQGGTNTITGTTDINTTGNATTTIGSITNTGGIILRADADIVIDVVDGVLPGTPNNLVLDNIAAESPITDLLWITATNQVRRAAFSSTADEGVIFESGAYRLGASNTTDVPFQSTRYINTDANSLILSATGTDFVEFNGSTQTVGIGKLADPEYRLDVDYSMTSGGSPEGAIRARSTNANGTANAAVAVRASGITDGSFAYGVEASATYNGTTTGLDPNRAVSGVFGSADNGGQDIIAIGGQFDASSGTAEGGNIGVFATGSNSTSGLNAGAAFGTNGLSVGNALLNTLNPTYDNVGLVSVGVNTNSLGAYIEGGQEGLRVEGSQVGIVIGELNSTPVSGIEIAATSVGLLVGLNAGTPNTGISVDANNVGIDVVDAPVSYSGDGSTVFGDDDTDTHEFQGVFEVNTGASSAAAQIGNGSGGSITLLADNNITLNPGNAAGNVILENIDVSVAPDNILTLTAGSEVRQKAFSGLADQGISWDAGAGEFVLGGATNADVPLTTSRFINLGTTNDLTVSSAAGNLMVLDGDATNPSVSISSQGTGTVSITGPTNINTTGTGATTIGNTTTGGRVEILSSGTNRILIQSASVNGQIDLDAVNTIVSGVLQVGDGSAGDAISVNTAGGADLLIEEAAITRSGSFGINPGAGNLLSTDGNFAVSGLATLNGGATIGNEDTDVTTIRGDVNINTTNTVAVATNIGTSTFANTITIGNNTASNTTNLNSPVITAPNLPAGANTDNLVTITGAGAVRSTSIATAIGNTAWLIGGNSLGAAGTVGTNDAFDFSIETNGTTRMTFGSTGANAGNVGLGTTADNEARLDVLYSGNSGTPRTGVRSIVSSTGTGSGAITGVRGASTGAGANTYGLSGSATFAGTVGGFTGAEKAVGVIASAQTGGQAIFGLGAELFSEQATTDGVNVGALTYAAGSGQINIGLAGGTNSTAMATTLSTLYAGPTLNVGVFAHNNTVGAGNFALYAEGPSNLNGSLIVSGSSDLNGGASIGDADGDVTTIRGDVNINTTNTAAVATNIGTSTFANTITIGNNTASNTTNLNSPVITAPNLPAGANTDNLVTITGAGAVRSTSIATALGNSAWLVNGNSLGAAGSVGTNDAFDFSIETNGATRMTFGSTGANAGNVGLGTTADNEARFDVSYTGQTGGPRTGIRSTVASSGTGVGAITGVRGSSTGAGANTYGLSGSATFAGTVGVFTGAEKAVGVIASAQTGGQAIFGLGAELFSEQATTDGVNVGALTYAAGSGRINIGLAGGTNSTAMATTLGTLYAGPTLNVGVFAHNNTGGAGDFALYAEGPSNLNGAVSIAGATTANGAVTANADVTLNNAINMPVEIGAAPTAINATAVVFIANGGLAGDDLTLPAAPSDGRVYIIRNASGVALDVAAGAGDSIEGAAVLALANGVSVKVIYVDATNTWYQIGN